jgi:excisionase family DNA binding protein
MPAKRSATEPQPDPVDDDRLNVNDSAAFLKISRANLERLMYAGEIDYLKVGGRLQFEKAELRRYLARCRVKVGR